MAWKRTRGWTAKGDCAEVEHLLVYSSSWQFAACFSGISIGGSKDAGKLIPRDPGDLEE